MTELKICKRCSEAKDPDQFEPRRLDCRRCRSKLKYQIAKKKLKNPKRLRAHLDYYKIWKRINFKKVRLSRGLEHLFDKSAINMASNDQLKIAAIHRLLKLIERNIIKMDEGGIYYQELKSSEDARDLALEIYQLPKRTGGLNNEY